MAHFRIKNKHGSVIAESHKYDSARQFIRSLAKKDRASRKNGFNTGVFVDADFDEFRSDLIAKGDASSIRKDGFLNLSAIDFSHCNLSGAIGRKIDLSKSSLKSCNLRGVSFKSSRFIASDFDGSIINSAKFINSNLRNASFKYHKWESKVAGETDSDDWLEHENPVQASHIDFSGSDLSKSTFIRTVAKGANLAGTRFHYASIEKANFSSSNFGSDDKSADFRRSIILRSILDSASISNMKTAGAKMINNRYWPRFKFESVINSNKNIISPLNDFIRNEWANVRSMPREMKFDYFSGIVTKAIVFGAAVTAASYALDLSVVSTAISTGLVSAAFASNITKTLFDAGTTDLLGRLANACGVAEKEGFFSKKSSAVFFGIGDISIKMEDAAEKGLDPEAYLDFHHNGVTAIVSSVENIENLFKHVEALNEFGNLNSRRITDNKEEHRIACEALMSFIDAGGKANSTGHSKGSLPIEINQFSLVVEREIGNEWPDEEGPWRVKLDSEGTVQATWRDDQGYTCYIVNYDTNGFPEKISDLHNNRVLNKEDIESTEDEKILFFTKRRVIFEDFKAGIARGATGADGKTHVTHISHDGKITVRSAKDGMLDNPNGPALICPDGTSIYFRDGEKVSIGPKAQLDLAERRRLSA